MRSRGPSCRVVESRRATRGFTDLVRAAHNHLEVYTASEAAYGGEAALQSGAIAAGSNQHAHLRCADDFSFDPIAERRPAAVDDLAIDFPSLERSLYGPPP